MGSRVRLKLAETLRAGLEEFSERWVRFLKANELAPETDESDDEASNRARLGFEVIANLLEGSEFSGYENVVRRLLHDWINRAATYADLLTVEEAFTAFLMPHLPVDPDSDEADEIRSTIDEFLHSDFRADILALYLDVYEEIIGAESSHTAYILGHFDAILSLTAHLNGAETSDEIIDGLAPAMEGLFDNVLASMIWTESPDGLKLRSVSVLDEEVPTAVIDVDLPEKLNEVFNTGEARWITENELPKSYKALIGVEIQSGFSGCTVPIRPREADGLLVLLIIGSEHPGTLELSLSRVASAECALALDRVKGREQLGSLNRRIRDVLSLSRETSWGSGYRETGEMVVEYLLDLTGGTRALLLATPTSSVGSRSTTPLSWRDVNEEDLNTYKHATKMHPIVAIPVRSSKSLLLTPDRLDEVLAGRRPPPGFVPSSDQALGILPFESNGRFQGVCLFLCPVAFATEPESADILAIFSRTAADSMATAREFERTTKMASIVEQDAERARILQQRLTARYMRTGKVVYWAHLHPAGELAGDVLTVRTTGDGRLSAWAADVAGRGTSAGWSMMFIRQLISEVPSETTHPSHALESINRVLHDVESQTSPGIFATLIGLNIDEKSRTGRFARAGTPGLHKVTPDGGIEKIDPEGLPLGLFEDAQLADAEFSFEPGDKVVWVSDGLLGIRDDKGSTWKESGLNDCIRTATFLPARALFEHILEAVGDYSTDDMARDDWSLVVIGFDPEPDWVESMPGGDRSDLLMKALDWLEERKACGNLDLTAIRMVIGEALTNAHEHGNRYNNDAKIEVKIHCSPRHVHLKVRDEGGKLNERVTNPHLRPGKILEDKGRGFLLMRHQSDFLWVEEDRGELNAVRLLGEDK